MLNSTHPFSNKPRRGVQCAPDVKDDSKDPITEAVKYLKDGYYKSWLKYRDRQKAIDKYTHAILLLKVVSDNNPENEEIKIRLAQAYRLRVTLIYRYK